MLCTRAPFTLSDLKGLALKPVLADVLETASTRAFLGQVSFLFNASFVAAVPSSTEKISCYFGGTCICFQRPHTRCVIVEQNESKFRKSEEIWKPEPELSKFAVITASQPTRR